MLLCLPSGSGCRGNNGDNRAVQLGGCVLYKLFTRMYRASINEMAGRQPSLHDGDNLRSFAAQKNTPQRQQPNGSRQI